MRFLRELFGEHIKRVGRNARWPFACGVATAGIGFVQTIVVARSLGVAPYGLLAMVMVYVTIVHQIVDFRIHEAAVRYISEFWVKKDSGRVAAAVKGGYLIDGATGVAAFLIVLFSAPWAAVHILRHPEAGLWIAGYALTLLFATVNGTSSAVLVVFGDFFGMFLGTLGAAVLQLVLVVIFILMGWGVAGVLAAYVLASLAGAVALAALATHRLRSRLDTAACKKSTSLWLLRDRWAEMLRFLVSTNLNELMTLVTKNIDILLLGYFRGVTDVGFYRLAKNFISLFSLVSDPIYLALYPYVTKLWHEGRKTELGRLVAGLMAALALFLLPVVGLIAWLIPALIRWTAGPSFLPAVICVRIMLAGAVISVVFLWIRPVYLAAGRPGVPTLINAAAAVTLVLLSLEIVPVFGLTGTSWLYVYPIVFGHALALIFMPATFRRQKVRGG